ncbi:hypothetical protein D3C74_419140 [compost metagenome]
MACIFFEQIAQVIGADVIFFGHLMDRQALLGIILVDIRLSLLHDQVVMRIQLLSRWIGSISAPVEIPIVEYIVIGVLLVPLNGFGGLPVQHIHKGQAFEDLADANHGVQMQVLLDI